MAIGSRSYFSLMRRNLIYRKRNIIGSFFEMALPVFMISILLIIKVSTDTDLQTFKNATFPTTPVIPFSFNDYVTAVQAERICDSSGQFGGGLYVSGMSPFDWQVPFVKCDSTLCNAADEDATTFCEYNILAVAGASALGDERARKLKNYTEIKYPGLLSASAYQNYDFVQIFESEEAIEDYVKAENYGNLENPKVALAIIFTGDDDKDYAYKIRNNSTNFNNPENAGRPAALTTPPTDQLFNNVANEDNVCTPEGGTPITGPDKDSCTYQYIYNGLLTVQRLLHDWILSDSGATDLGYGVAEHGVQFVSFPTRSFLQDGFYSAISDFAPLLLVLGLLYPVAAMIRGICLEKQLRQKELMKMMSVNESDIGWSWFTSFTLFHLFTVIFTTLTTAALYENTSGVLLFIFWLFGYIAIICFSMVIASIFTRATTATLVGLLVFFVGFFLTFAADFATGSASTISAVSLHPIAAIAYGINEIGRLEDAGNGVTVDTFSTTDSPSGFTFLTAIQSLVGDCLIWGILSWYLNRIIKSDLGQPLPFYFPFTASYWCPSSGRISDDGPYELKNSENVPVEPVEEALRAQIANGQGIDIRGLKKDFGDKTAVDGLELSMFTNQITALLGHNGAGKTTTISMLTGMLKPTEGHAIIAGKDIRTQMNAIRQEIGICLQHDCLFPQLTVKEHLQFFARIKGFYKKVSRQEAEAKIQASMEDVALAEKANTLSKNLSGGMKRKLSVAIAFCGDSKTVLLDEPTSGMDPFSRRFTWNVIRQYRQDRCIILTTHFMDEADVLGDRIAIMAEGQLRCAGSSLFLKKQYGVGYQLTIEKKSSDIGSSIKASGHGSVDSTHDDRLKGIVTGTVTGASLLSNVGTELSFQLPLGASSEFTPMFQSLDDEVDSGNIVTYGVSITTLDEVFLLVARGDTGEKMGYTSSRLEKENPDEPALGDDNGSRSVRSQMDLTDKGMFSTHVTVLFRKRALNFKRDKKAWFCTTFLPSAAVLLGLIFFTFLVPTRNLVALEIDLDEYNGKLASSITPTNPIPFNSPDNSFTCQPGVCVSPGLSVVVTKNETYSFCGAPYFGKDSPLGGLDCVSTQQEAGVAQITENGAQPVALDVTDTLSTSLALAESALQFAASQYGAILFSHDQGTSADYYSAAIAACQNVSAIGTFLDPEFCENYNGVGYVIDYNFTALHAAPTYQVFADQALVREATGDADVKISATIHPLPITSIERGFGSAEDATFAWFLIVLSFPFIAGAFATFIVTERSTKAKHLQTVAGVKPAAYWVSSFVWDLMNYQLPLWITIILMFAFGVDTFTTSERSVSSGTIITLFLFGPASAGFTYCLTFLFTSASMCNLFVIIFSFVIGYAGPLAAFILRIIGENVENPNDSLILAANIVEWCLRFVPSFNLGSGLFKVVNVQFYEFIKGEPLTVWDPTVILYETIFQGALCVLYLILAIQLDVWSTNPRMVNLWKTITCRCSGGRAARYVDLQPEDEDVKAEEERVLVGDANNDLIVLNKMSKQYSNGKVAVNNMSLGIPPGQCFGLLGINGAGKTTTMAMLTAEFPPTFGDATLAGYSVVNEPEKTRRRIGYCPQFDAHFTNMTGREHVALYAAIKGVPNNLIAEATEAKLAEVGLSEYDSDRVSSGYSGGMKRKLSVACATIGNPQIVFLDEPSTGMDPVARRDMWKVISDMVSAEGVPDEQRTSVILTTHSMEECEALCSRLGIMANAHLRCIGSAQHLKTRFGQGFQVQMKLADVDTSDEDYILAYRTIADAVGGPPLDDGEVPEFFLNLEQTARALEAVTGDDSLSSKLNAEDQTGYAVWTAAKSPIGVPLEEVASFAVSEKRIAEVELFFADNFKTYALRERQFNNVRYEVGSEGVRISSIFSLIEENKETLFVTDYGVSQTSLEQVFNMHAAEAEKVKHGTYRRPTGTEEAVAASAPASVPELPKAEIGSEIP